MTNCRFDGTTDFKVIQRHIDHHFLETIVSSTPGDYDVGEWAFGLNTFVITGIMTRELCSAHLKDLRNRGLVQYIRGLFSDEGETAGSGYTITPAGLERLEEIKFTETNDDREELEP